jgi:GH24 family phage-related lysozyme (muramidase)
MARLIGFRLAAYRCPSGALTVGYGHNCDASPVDGVARVGDRILREEAERLFLAACPTIGDHLCPPLATLAKFSL